jgi:hypothetical protein
LAPRFSPQYSRATVDLEGQLSNKVVPTLALYWLALSRAPEDTVLRSYRLVPMASTTLIVQLAETVVDQIEETTLLWIVETTLIVQLAETVVDQLEETTLLWIVETVKLWRGNGKTLNS